MLDEDATFEELSKGVTVAEQRLLLLVSLHEFVFDFGELFLGKLKLFGFVLEETEEGLGVLLL